MRRVREHALDRLLPTGDEVRDRHREHREPREDRRPARRPEPSSVSPKASEEHAQHHREAPRSSRRRPCTSVAGRGRALVGVGRPHVERHRAHLEGEPDEHEHRARRPPAASVVPLAARLTALADAGEVGVPGRAVEQRAAVEQQRGGEGAEQEVLDRRLGRARATRGGSRSARTRRATSSRGRGTAMSRSPARGEHHGADGREHEQRVELAALELVLGQVAAREQRRPARRRGRCTKSKKSAKRSTRARGERRRASERSRRRRARRAIEKRRAGEERDRRAERESPLAVVLFGRNASASISEQRAERRRRGAARARMRALIDQSPPRRAACGSLRRRGRPAFERPGVGARPRGAARLVVFGAAFARTRAL